MRSRVSAWMPVAVLMIPFEVTGGVSGEYRDFDYSAAVSWFDSRGIDARRPTPGRFGVDQPDKDGYDNISVQFSGSYDFSETARIDDLHHEGGRNDRVRRQLPGRDRFPAAGCGRFAFIQPGRELGTRPCV